MSKKIAAGAEGIVLDIKVGSGAFMKDLDQATELAESLVTVGKQAGLKAMAVISDMNQPLGHKIGNSLEIEVSIDLLKGKAPEDITELTVKLTSLMLVMSGVRESEEAARELVLEKIASGEALAKFREMEVKMRGRLDGCPLLKSRSTYCYILFRKHFLSQT